MPSNYLNIASPWATAGAGLQDLANMILGLHAEKKAEGRRKEDISRADRMRAEDIARAKQFRDEDLARDEKRYGDTLSFRNQQAKNEAAGAVLPYTAPNTEIDTSPFAGTPYDALFTRKVGFGPDKPVVTNVGGVELRGITPGEVSFRGQRGPSFAESQGMAANARADRQLGLAENADRRAGAMHDLDFGLGQMRNRAYQGMNPATRDAALTGTYQHPERPQFGLSFEGFNPDGSLRLVTTQTNRPGVTVNQPPPTLSEASIQAVEAREYDDAYAAGMRGLQKDMNGNYNPAEVEAVRLRATQQAKEKGNALRARGAGTSPVVNDVLSGTLSAAAKDRADMLIGINAADAKSMDDAELKTHFGSQWEAAKTYIQRAPLPLTAPASPRGGGPGPVR